LVDLEFKINFTRMEIGQYIEEILKERGKVSIPGVGTFYNKRNPAYFDESQQLYFPPSRKLTFKLIEEENTSVFSEFISKKEHISVVSADRLLEKFSAKFITQLGTTGTAEIEGLGKLKRQGVDYIFETFSFYGLEPVEDVKPVFPEVNDAEEKEIKAPDPQLPEEIVTVESFPEHVEDQPDIEDTKLPETPDHHEVEDITEPEPVMEIGEEDEKIEEQQQDIQAEEPLAEEPPIEIIETESFPAAEPDEEEDYLAFRLRQREEEKRKQQDNEQSSAVPFSEPVFEQPLREEPVAEEPEQVEPIRQEPLREPAPEPVRAPLSSDSIFQNIINPAEFEEDILPEEEVEEKSWKKWLLITILVMVLVLGGLLFYFYPQIRQYRARFQSVPVQQEKLVTTDTTILKVDDSIGVLPVDTALSAADSAKVATPPQISFELVISTFTTKAEAQALIAKLKAKNKNVYLIEMPTGKYKYDVSAGGYKKIAEAEAHKQQAITDFKDFIPDINQQIRVYPIEKTK
jgi:nucleoid DNA-binding protein